MIINQGFLGKKFRVVMLKILKPLNYSNECRFYVFLEYVKVPYFI